MKLEALENIRRTAQRGLQRNDQEQTDLCQHILNLCQEAVREAATALHQDLSDDELDEVFERRSGKD